MAVRGVYGIFAIVLTSSLVYLVSAQADDFDESDVVVLDNENFQETVKAVKYALVEFYAPWCGHCKQLAPEYAAAATALRHDEDVIIAKIDATENTDLAEQFQVKGFPTIIFKKESEWMQYTGGRDRISIQKWVEKKMGPLSIPLQTEEDGVPLPAVVAYLKGNRDSALYETFLEAAKLPELDDFVFADAADQESDRIALFLPGDDHEHAPMFDGTWAGDHINTEERDPTVLRNWVLNRGYPRILQVPDLYSVMVARGYPSALVFIDLDDNNEDLMKRLEEADAQTEGTFTWAVADGIKFAKFMADLGVGPDLPAIGAFGADNQKKYAYTHDVESVDQLTTWAKGIVAGTAQRYYKTEPEPEDNSEDVTVVVGTTFEDIVLDRSTDVLLEIYAPWCGHCKKLAPIYEQLGAHFADDDGIVIAKLDGTLNDIPVPYRGFPTLKFFPALPGGLATAMDYNGARDYDSLLSFIKENRQSEESETEGKEEL